MAEELISPEVPTFYFIGMTTAKSSIMKVFPEWSNHLKLDTRLAGIDCKWHDDPERYRQVVRFIKSEPNALGGLVTTHKLDILDAARDLFDGLGHYAEVLGEISSISKRGDKLWGHAKDPITSGLALEAFLPADHWHSGGVLCLLGAGGSSLAMSTYCMEQPADNRPQRIIVTNRSLPRLESMKLIHEKLNPGIVMEYHHCPKPEDNDGIVNGLPDGSVVANATGLGKDAPGSPLTDAAKFPQDGYAWEFNYRGDLLFLDQARAQEQSRGLTVEDGWVYFVHGWTRVMAEVFHIDIPTSGPGFDQLSTIAANARKS
jgi:shikimate 5-dehydrogenase